MGLPVHAAAQPSSCMCSCPKGCSKCVDAAACLECNGPQVVNDVRGQVADPASGQCVPCASMGCLSCPKGPDVCELCYEYGGYTSTADGKACVKW